MQPTHSIWDIRKEYKQESLSENDVNDNAIQQFSAWWNEAIKSKIEEVNAMTLATASRDGLPSARIVLLKNGDTIAQKLGTSMEFSPDGPGVFWVELYLDSLQAPVNGQPWVISNPIYVR